MNQVTDIRRLYIILTNICSIRCRVPVRRDDIANILNYAGVQAS